MQIMVFYNIKTRDLLFLRKENLSQDIFNNKDYIFQKSWHLNSEEFSDLKILYSKRLNFYKILKPVTEDYIYNDIDRLFLREFFSLHHAFFDKKTLQKTFVSNFFINDILEVFSRA